MHLKNIDKTGHYRIAVSNGNGSFFLIEKTYQGMKIF